MAGSSKFMEIENNQVKYSTWLFSIYIGLMRTSRIWLQSMKEGVLQLLYWQQFHLMGGLASPQTHQALGHNYKNTQ